MNINELIYLYFQKDEQALPDLIEQLKPLTVKVLKESYDFNGCDAAAREDYFAAANLALVQALECFRLDGVCDFTHFYRLCLRRRVIDLGRRQKVDCLARSYEVYSLDRRVKENDGVTYGDLCADKRENIHDRVMDRVQADYLLHHLRNGLSELDYDIYKLRLSGYTLDEIAEQVNLSCKKVRTALSRAKRLLDSLTAG